MHTFSLPLAAFMLATCCNFVWAATAELTLEKIVGDRRFRHAASITHIELIPDRQEALTSGMDFLVRHWDLKTGLELKRFKHAHAQIWHVAYVENEHRALSCGGDGFIRLWELQTGHEIRSFDHENNTVFRFVYDKASDRIWSCTGNNKVWCWRYSTGEKIRLSEPHKKSVYGIALSPDGKLLATCSDDKRVKLLNGETLDELHTLKGHQSSVNTVAFSLDGTRLFSCGEDKFVKVWDVEKGTEIKSLETPNGNFVVKPHLDGKALWLTGRDKQLRLLQLETGQVELELPLKFESHYSIAHDPRQNAVYSGSNILHRWKLEDKTLAFPMEDLQGHIQPPIAFEVLNDQALSVGSDGRSVSWDLKKGAVSQVKIFPDSISSACIHPSLKRIFVFSSDSRTASVLDAASLDSIATSRLDAGISDNQHQLVNDRQLLFATYNAILRWEIDREQPETVFQQERPHRLFCVSPLGEYYVVAFSADRLDFHRLDGHKISSLEVKVSETGSKDDKRNADDYFNFGKISPNGKLLIAGTRNGRLCLWKARLDDAKSSAREGELAKWAAQLQSESFQERQQAIRLLSAAGAEAARYLNRHPPQEDPETRMLLRQLQSSLVAGNLPSELVAEISCEVKEVAFHPDEKYFCAIKNVDRQRTLTLFEIGADNLKVHCELSAPEFGQFLRWSKDGQKLYMLNSTGTISVYTFKPGE